jgi:uncharacterized protein YbjQ (UPF0145 family)
MTKRSDHRPIDLDRSVARVASGGIPLRAEERLAEAAGDHRRLFTSDLSVPEFLLGRDAGCEPISQVMGSSVLHVGQISDYKGKTAEVTTLTSAHRHARQAALERLRQEATLVGADAVIGVHLRERMITMGARGKGGDDGGEVLEFTVVGTAVKAPWINHPEGKPVLTDLSGQDLWALHHDGFEPCGIVFEFCHYHVWHVLNPLDLDPEFGKRLQREGGATGEIRISLLWNNTNDLDLHVIPPSGEEICFSHKKSQCGGELDIDMNAGSRMSQVPIENVYWAHGGAPRGKYKVRVKQYRCRDVRSCDYRVEVLAGGQVTHYDANITGEGIETVCTFDYQGTPPMEIPQAKSAIEHARTTTAEKLRRQAEASGAEFVVGSELEVKVREVSCGFAGCELNDLDVEVSWFGTGIRKIPGWKASEKGVPPFVLAMLPVGRRRDSEIDGQDDSNDIEFAAEEAEEAAAVADEVKAFDTELAVQAAEAAEAARGGE